MPTLQRYKKIYQDRIPVGGQGRKQRYPESALPVFDEIKNENVGRRGRPRKDASAPPAACRRGAWPRRRRKPARRGKRGLAARRRAPGGGKRSRLPCAAPSGAAKPGPGAGSGQSPDAHRRSASTTGISYPTLVRYVRLYSDRLPHEGKGRARRFYPEAVDVFRSSARRAAVVAASRAAAPAAARAGRVAGRARRALTREFSPMRLRGIEKSQQASRSGSSGLVAEPAEAVR